jgi:hypothetical protein
VPTVALTAEAFVRDARKSAESFGIPDLPLAVVPLPFTNQPAEAIRAAVSDALEQVIAGLMGEAQNTTPAQELMILPDEYLSFTGADALEAAEHMNRAFLEYGWSDGLVLRPPTPRAVDTMLAGTRRAADEVVAVLEPGFGKATVHKAAANAVMAGCRPEHLPVLLAALECLAEPAMHLRNKAMSTGSHAPLMWVNGPARRRAGLNSGMCALGPGAPSYANVALGRALRLCMMNLGHCYAGVSDMDTVGTPAKFSMCVAENEERSPWPPYHVERGFAREQGVVTVHFVYGLCELFDFASDKADRLLSVFASPPLNLAQVSTAMWLIGRRADPRYGTEEKEHHTLFVCPEHAQLLSRGGFDKPRVRDALHGAARIPFRDAMLNKERKAMESAHPELMWMWEKADTLVPVVEDPGCYELVVVGGAAGRGAFFWGSGEPRSRPVTD